MQLRFRIATDSFFGLTGWTIDDIAVSGIDNTPFPALVPEPSVCTPASAALDGPVIAVHTAPATSLASLDAACAAAEAVAAPGS